MNAWSKPHKNNDPIVLLPVDGSQPLEFIITLKVFYTEEGVVGIQEGIFTYTATTSKTLLNTDFLRYIESGRYHYIIT